MSLKIECECRPTLVRHETEAAAFLNPILPLDSILAVLHGLQGSTRQKRANDSQQFMRLIEDRVLIIEKAYTGWELLIFVLEYEQDFDTWEERNLKPCITVVDSFATKTLQTFEEFLPLLKESRG